MLKVTKLDVNADTTAKHKSLVIQTVYRVPSKYIPQQYASEQQDLAGKTPQAKTWMK